MLKQLTTEIFDKEIAKGVAVVDFYGRTCMPCKVLAPQIEQLAEESDFTVAKVEVDSNPELVDRFRIMSVPTVIFFKDGVPVDQFTGFRPKEVIADMAKSL